MNTAQTSMDSQLLFDRAVGLHQEGNLAEAERIYSQILAGDSVHFGSRHMLGVLRNQQGRKEEALELIGAALALAPYETLALVNYGNILSGTGRLDEALASYDRAIAVEPRNVKAHNRRGIVLHTLGRFNEALAAYETVLALKPGDAGTLNNRGNTLLALRRFDDALASYDGALQTDPAQFDALYNRGNALFEQGRFGQALASFDKALAARPNHVDALVNRANSLLALGRFEDSLAGYEAALAIKPRSLIALNNRGNALRELRRHDEAIASYDRALALKPDYLDALHNRANAMWEQLRFEDALAGYGAILAIQPLHLGALYNRANVLRELKRFGEALESYEKALALQPNLAAGWTNRGITLRDLHRPSEALSSFDHAIRIDPGNAQAYWYKSLCHLLMENYEEAWRLFDWHRKLPAPLEARDYAQPFWTGAQDINGKTLFVYTQQGFGDTIQYFRYIALLQARGAKVVLAAQDSMSALLGRANPALALGGSEGVPENFDYHISLISLPQAFGTTKDTVPANVPYLAADPARVERWADKIGKTGFKIGVAWQGLRSAGMGDRWFPLESLEAISKIPGVRLISLQKNTGADQLQGLPKGMKVESLGEGFDDGPDAFADTAAVMENLDLVITPCTSIAHLAGALGRPTWVALKHVPDWRWALDRPDSPWYPTMRLFRQQVDGEWTNVFAQMEKQLVPLAGAK